MKSLFVILAMLFVWTFEAEAAPQQALVVHDGSLINPGPNVRTQLASRLTAKGYAVTQNSGIPPGSLSAYRQIWDLRYSSSGAPPGNPFTTDESTAYLTYLQGGGSLFLMGENGISFSVRNQAIRDFIQAAGGGTISLLSTTNNAQTAQAPFTGPNAISSVTYSSVGGVSSPLPKGSFVTKDASNGGAAIVFSPGDLSNATTGTLLAVFDVNFLQSSASDALQSLVDNIIAYLAGPAPSASADLKITKTQSITSPIAGQNISYTVVVANNGPNDATNALVSDFLPANTTFVSASGPSGWTLSTPAVGINGTVTATRATLSQAAGDQTISITVNVNVSAPSSSTLTNLASVSSDTTDPNPANNSSSVNATVAAAPIDGACGSSASAATAFLPTVNLCSAGTASTVTPGSTSWAWSCTGTGSTNATCSAPYPPVTIGGGTVGAVQTPGTNGWQINQAASGFVALPAPAPAGVTLPGGATKVVLNTGTPGTSTTVTLRFSSIPAGAVMYKYGKENATDVTDKWYPYPATIDQAAGTVTYTLTDGQKGDNDWTVNGVIDDPVALGAPVAAAAVESIPTLSEWAMALLAGLMGLATFLKLRRRNALM